MLPLLLLVTPTPVVGEAAATLLDAQVRERPTANPAAEVDEYLRRLVPFGFSGQIVIEVGGKVALDGALRLGRPR